MAYYLGIDGGGTKTRCVLADERTVLAKSMSGGSNIVRLGETQAREALSTALRQVCAAAKISPDQVRAICVGAAGAARPEIAEKIRNILAELVREIAPARIEVVGDAVIALEAAFGAGPGVIAIAGTGSIVYGRDAAGRTARAGGWGFAVSDEGSGYWIGRRAISAILSARDQGLETTLTAMVLQSWKLATIDELVQHANSTPPPDFPRLFPIVLRAADQADAIAGELLADAGAKLAALAAIVVRSLAPFAPEAMSATETTPVSMLPVAMTGSVFRQSPYVRQVFYNTLQKSFPGIDVRQDLADPVEGALARARAMRM
ncbi:MAG TPA: BadF/BadG/BcrA/BcrD ATPase family protein [Terriglobales bacterium]|jgi:glucosamine kinase|nr:BadF/BadG/BcrA/BcrD ATPase family protein [Terriglobales bacterium]